MESHRTVGGGAQFPAKESQRALGRGAQFPATVTQRTASAMPTFLSLIYTDRPRAQRKAKERQVVVPTLLSWKASERYVVELSFLPRKANG
eukprot:4503429-Pyramimonas_sp.AAC.1